MRPVAKSFSPSRKPNRLARNRIGAPEKIQCACSAAEFFIVLEYVELGPTACRFMFSIRHLRPNTRP